jgi:nucleotide-binding universal stress UspA family protein
MDEQPHGVIVVGVDGSPGSDAALDFALSEGLARGCAVEVVTGWLPSSPSDGLGHPSKLAEGRAVMVAMQDAALAAALARLGATPPVSRYVVHDYAGRVLVARSEHASIVVVGGGAQNPSSRKSVGSVAEYVVRHAVAPVVVVPDPARARRRASRDSVVTVAAS